MNAKPLLSALLLNASHDGCFCVLSTQWWHHRPAVALSLLVRLLQVVLPASHSESLFRHTCVLVPVLLVGLQLTALP